MKDRLIELLKTSGMSEEFTTVEEVSDHLIANGVIVPPVKVGQTVYSLYPKEKHWDALNRKWIITAWEIGEYNIVSMHYSENKQSKKTLKYRCSRIDIPSVCRDHSVDEIGKTVFLTKEEAEKALAEMEDKE